MGPWTTCSEFPLHWGIYAPKEVPLGDKGAPPLLSIFLKEDMRNPGPSE